MRKRPASRSCSILSNMTPALANTSRGVDVLRPFSRSARTRYITLHNRAASTRSVDRFSRIQYLPSSSGLHTQRASRLEVYSPQHHTRDRLGSYGPAPISSSAPLSHCRHAHAHAHPHLRGHRDRHGSHQPHRHARNPLRDAANEPLPALSACQREAALAHGKSKIPHGRFAQNFTLNVYL